MTLKKLGYGPHLSGAGSVCPHSNLVRLCNTEGESLNILECLTCKAQFRYSDQIEETIEGLKRRASSSSSTVPAGESHNTRSI